MLQLISTQTTRPRRSTLFPYTTLFRSTILIAPSGDHELAEELTRHGARVITWPRIEIIDQVITRAPCRVSSRSEEHTSELQSPDQLVCRLLLEKQIQFPASYTPSPSWS